MNKFVTAINSSKGLIEKHKTLFPFLTFLSGFIVDLMTLNRIDQSGLIIQQGLYLVILFTLLGSLFLKPNWSIPKYLFVEKLLNYRTAALHFFFGALLSAYTIFYFKSSSIVVSFIFLIFMATLLVINEHPKFQNLGLGIKSALSALCLISYFGYLVPIIFGIIGISVFMISLLCSGVLLWGFVSLLLKHIEFQVVRRQVIIPFVGIGIFFFLSYFTKILPPVPLSLQYVGVYHTIEKTSDGKYQLGHYKPWWKFWQNGDQSFFASDSDQVIVFFRLFAPRSFEEEIRLQWSRKNKSGDWEVQDNISIAIAGGRDLGFRGYGQKSHFLEGDWKTQVLTSDNREIGRIHFTIKNQIQNSELKFDIH